MSKKAASMLVVLAMSAGLAGCATSTTQHWTKSEEMGRDMIRAQAAEDHKLLEKQRNIAQQAQYDDQAAVDQAGY